MKEFPMNVTETTSDFPPALVAELRGVLDNVAGGIRDPEAARNARERMDRIREENRRLFGEQNLAVELIRRGRDRA
jgi:hypothetical protein